MKKKKIEKIIEIIENAFENLYADAWRNGDETLGRIRGKDHFLNEIKSNLEKIETDNPNLNNNPYIITEKTVIEKKYNKDFGDERVCECGHPYYRHFDTYDNMYACGCKYCGCQNFIESNYSIYKSKIYHKKNG